MREVDLLVKGAEVHGLVGENGSGKSTLMKILAGLVTPEPGGVIEVYGRRLHVGSIASAMELGVAMVPQELTLVPQLSAAENVFLGEYRRWGPLARKTVMREDFDTLCRGLGVEIAAGTECFRLAPAAQVMVEVMRALSRNARIIVMDEPTAALGPVEREHIYALLRAMKASGATVMFISHDLGEVLTQADSVTVLRDGARVETGEVASWTKEALVRAMLGSAARPGHGARQRPTEKPTVVAGHQEELVGAMLDSAAFQRGHDARKGPTTRPKTAAGHAPPASAAKLDIVGLTVPGMVRSASLDVRAGEILGLAGLVGSGRSTLLRAVVGRERVSEGVLRIDGDEKPWPRSPHAAIRLGIAYLPEERRAAGLVLGMKVEDNVVLSDLRRVTRSGILVGRRTAHEATRQLSKVGFTGRLGVAVGSQSGGNQQKVLLAKWLHRAPQILLIDEPTRGIDIRAKTEIMAELRALADAGIAMVVVSSELEELVALADRITLIRAGSTIGQLARADASVSEILRRLFDVAGPEDDVPPTEHASR